VVLETRNWEAFSAKLGRKVLKGVDIKVRKGEIVGIVEGDKAEERSIGAMMAGVRSPRKEREIEPNEEAQGGSK